MSKDHSDRPSPRWLLPKLPLYAPFGEGPQSEETLRVLIGSGKLKRHYPIGKAGSAVRRAEQFREILRVFVELDVPPVQQREQVQFPESITDELWERTLPGSASKERDSASHSQSLFAFNMFNSPGYLDADGTTEETISDSYFLRERGWWTRKRSEERRQAAAGERLPHQRRYTSRSLQRRSVDSLRREALEAGYLPTASSALPAPTERKPTPSVRKPQPAPQPVYSRRPNPETNLLVKASWLGIVSGVVGAVPLAGLSIATQFPMPALLGMEGARYSFGYGFVHVAWSVALCLFATHIRGAQNAMTMKNRWDADKMLTILAIFCIFYGGILEQGSSYLPVLPDLGTFGVQLYYLASAAILSVVIGTVHSGLYPEQEQMNLTTYRLPMKLRGVAVVGLAGLGLAGGGLLVTGGQEAVLGLALPVRAGQARFTHELQSARFVSGTATYKVRFSVHNIGRQPLRWGARVALLDAREFIITQGSIEKQTFTQTQDGDPRDLPLIALRESREIPEEVRKAELAQGIFQQFERITEVLQYEEEETREDTPRPAFHPGANQRQAKTPETTYAPVPPMSARSFEVAFANVPMEPDDIRITIFEY